MRGTVKCFFSGKGYGFLVSPECAGADVMVHYKAIVGEGFQTLHKGEVVDFVVEQTEKGLNAVWVRPLTVRASKWSRSKIDLAYALAATVAAPGTMTLHASARVAFGILEEVAEQCAHLGVKTIDNAIVAKIAARIAAGGRNVGQSVTTALNLMLAVREVAGEASAPPAAEETAA